MFSISWSSLAEFSYEEEASFILKKWNQKEVDKFGLLVENQLLLLKSNPFVGKFDKKKLIFSFVISKQTTLFYKIDSDNSIIYLVLFWNNQKNPKDLMKPL